MPGNRQLDVLKVLGDDTRYAIYTHLARSAEPLCTQDLADALGLHPNTVRPHLERMRDVGLVEVDTGSRGGVGRPQHRYSLSASAPSLGLQPPMMPVLATMILELAERMGATRDDAYRLGREQGTSAARLRPATAGDGLAALVADLDDGGFAPCVHSTDHASSVITIAHCPFRSLAQDHAEVVCAMHQGMVEGFADTVGDIDVCDFRPLADSGACQVAVSAR